MQHHEPYDHAACLGDNFVKRAAALRRAGKAGRKGERAGREPRARRQIGTTAPWERRSPGDRRGRHRGGDMDSGDSARRGGGRRRNPRSPTVRGP